MHFSVQEGKIFIIDHVVKIYGKKNKTLTHEVSITLS